MTDKEREEHLRNKLFMLGRAYGRTSFLRYLLAATTEKAAFKLLDNAYSKLILFEPTIESILKDLNIKETK